MLNGEMYFSNLRKAIWLPWNIEFAALPLFEEAHGDSGEEELSIERKEAFIET